MILLNTDAIESDSTKELECIPQDIVFPDCAISYHALAGELVPQTLRFQGLINGIQLNVLVDTGSTHNFI